MESLLQRRRLPVGAETLSPGGVHFRVWAPRCHSVSVIFENQTDGKVSEPLPLTEEENGYFSLFCPRVREGDLYRYRLHPRDGEGTPSLYPDPASRFQPLGPHGPSRVVDASTFPWTDHRWRGVELTGQVVYEMHIGTFTKEGTWEAARRELPYLAEIGITLLELMPVGDFSGRFGWGYDGVDLFAPTRLYGTPDDFRGLINEAHRLNMGVVLDVVYNHLGPDGNYLKQFSKDYFTDRYENEWGEAINFDGPGSEPVRDFFITNARYWVEEFHLDGLRLDATQQIFDRSSPHILAEIVRAIRKAAKERPTLVVVENEPQKVQLLLPPEKGGYGMDAVWNDDFHHSAMVALTGRDEAYYSDYTGSPQEFVSSAKRGFLFQGQYYTWQKKRRGTPTSGVKPEAFIHYLQNHDQIANSGRGWRCHFLTTPGRYRAMTALLLLSPQTPMLFQGQEFAASSPFLYFADHAPDLARLVEEGRFAFLRQFGCLAGKEFQPYLAKPNDLSTFERSKLDLSERESHREAYELHRDLLNLRREDPVFRRQRVNALDGAVLGPESFLLRFFGGEEGDRLLLVNLGRDIFFSPAPEPLLAPPEGSRWKILWSSEDPRYGGCGTPSWKDDSPPHIPGHAALVLKSSSE